MENGQTVSEGAGKEEATGGVSIPVELEGSVTETREVEYFQSIPIPEYKIGWVIGKQGSYIKQLQAKSGAVIKICDTTSREYGTVWKYIQVQGNGRQLDRVKKLLHIRFERLDASEDVRDGAKGAPISGDFEGGGEREKATKNVVVLQLLQTLASAEKSVREKGEAEYERMKKDEKDLPLGLLEVVMNQQDQEDLASARMLALVLLRRLVVGNGDQDSAYRSLSESSQILLKNNLLACLSNHPDSRVRERICDIVGELSGYVLEQNEWPEIVSFCASCVSSTSEEVIETGIKLLGMLATSHIALFLSAEYIASIVTTLSNGLTAGSSSLKIASMKTMTSLATMIPQQSHLEPFYVLIEKMIHALQQLCMAYSTSDGEKELELATEFITCMIELGEERGTLFVPQLEPCFNSIMDIVESNLKPNSSINHLLVEFLVTLCSSITKQCRKIKSPTTAAEKGHFGARLLPYCAKMMLNVEFDPEWATSEELDDTLHEINDFTTGDNAFSEISSALGLRSTFTLVFDILKNLLSSPEESKKYAGLHIIANYVEVTCKIPDKNQLEQHRIDISTTLIGYTSDIHPRVRAASFYGIFKFASTHGDSLTQSQTDDFLKVLLSALSIATNPSPRVRQYALLGLISILDITPEESLGRWAGIILGQIANTLTESPLIVQEQCVTVISTLANSVDGEIMKNYYDSIMPILKQLLEYASSNKMEILWGSTLECCAMVGECVGKEKFHTDAVEMMNTLVSLQALEDMKKYLLKAWVRIARCMGKDFIPYLQPVMVQIFVAIEQNISQGTGDIDLDELDDLEKRSDIDIIEDADGMWIAVRTAAVEEQASACELLYLIVEKMQEDYFPYVEQTVKAMIPLLKSPQEDIRSHTVVVMPELIKCVAISCSKRLIDHQSLVQINSFVLGNLIEFVQTENIIELVMTGLQGIRQMILFASTKWDIVNPEINKKSSKKLDKAILTPDKSNPLLTVEQMNAISDCLQIVLRDSIQRRAILRAETQVNGDRDEDDIDDEKELLTTSLELCYNIGELMGALLRTHSYEYTKVFLSHWHEMIMNMVHVQCIKEDRQFACFVISDVIEFGFHMADDKQIVEQYFASVIPALVSINQDAPELECRQISAYALGIAAQNFFSIFMPYVMQSLNSLASSSSKGRDQSTDNCISAIGIILEQVEMHKEHFPAFDFNSTWNQWLSYLPLKNDVEEGEKVILQLQRILASPNHVYLKEQIASRQNNGDELSFFLQTVLQQSSSQTHGNVFSSSPGMTAPIHDVLLGNR